MAMNIRQPPCLFGTSMSILFMILCCKIPLSESITMESNDLRLLPSPTRSIRARKVQAGLAYNVHLFLSLDYLNETVALLFESTNTTHTNDVTTHFCFAVNSQSSGNQVAYNAALVPASIQTSSFNSDYECSIVRSIRDYNVGSDQMSQGLFRLQVLVEQIVYADAEERKLTLQEVRSIVETGFTRGQGGRVQFRSLLMLHPAFRTVVNIEVLGSFPSLTPSVSPLMTYLSPAPSDKLSDSPSIVSPMTNLPFYHPSTIPIERPLSTTGPSLTPSTYPSSVSAYPTSQRPSLIASPGPTDAPTASPTNDRALVVGAIVGGIAIILATLYFRLCIWLPFCGRQKNNDQYDIDGPPGAYPVPTNSLPTSSQSQIAVPQVLTLDDDVLSLANTTLDGNSSAQLLSHGQSAVNGQITSSIHANESFDESSIYTSNTNASNSAPYSSYIVTAEQDCTANVDINSKSQAGSISVTALGTSRSETKGFDPFDDEYEHFADDESSIGFGKGVTLFDSSGNPLKIDDSSTRVPNSSRTGIVEDEIALDLSGLPNNERLFLQHDVHIGGVVNAGDDSVSQFSIKDSIQADSSTLQYHFLKDSVFNAAPDSLKSHVSRQSAPSRLSEHDSVPKSKVVSSHGRPPPYGHRHNGTDSIIGMRSASLSSRSTDDSKRSRFIPNATKSNLLMSHNKLISQPSNFLTNESISESHDPLLDEFVGLQMPSTDKNMAEADVFGNVLVRKPLFEAVLRAESDAPTYSSGQFGASSGLSSIYDTSSESGRSGSWHVDTDENTLDSRQRVVDDRSVSSRSSHSSKLSSFGRSVSSFAFGKSVEQSTTQRNGNNGRERFRADPVHEMVRSSKNDSRTGIAHEEKTAEHLCIPDSSHRPSLSIAGGTSSISGSSTSRSTLSSKFDSHFHKKYVEVFVPPGKINIVLADFRNGNGTIISEVRSSSALLGMLTPGDELVAIDDDDVSKMMIAEISAMIASRAGRERKLTVLRVSPAGTQYLDFQETKQEGSS